MEEATQATGLRNKSIEESVDFLAIRGVWLPIFSSYGY